MSPAVLKPFAAGAAVLLAVLVRPAQAETWTFYGPDGPHTAVARDRPPLGQTRTDRFFSVPEMAVKCLLFKFQSTPRPGEAPVEPPAGGVPAHGRGEPRPSIFDQDRRHR